MPKYVGAIVAHGKIRLGLNENSDKLQYTLTCCAIPVQHIASNMNEAREDILRAIEEKFPFPDLNKEDCGEILVVLEELKI